MLTAPKAAIYLDGYQYHASTENNRFLNDVKKRLAIHKSSEFISWTLTWDDINKFEESFLKEKDQENREDFLELKFKETGYKKTKATLLKSFTKNHQEVYKPRTIRNASWNF